MGRKKPSAADETVEVIEPTPEERAYAAEVAAATAAIDEVEMFRRTHDGAEYVGGDTEKYRYFTIAGRSVDGEPKKPGEDARFRSLLKRRGYIPDPDGVTNTMVTNGEVWRVPRVVFEAQRLKKIKAQHNDPIWLSTQLSRTTPGFGFVDQSLIPQKMRERMEGR